MSPDARSTPDRVDERKLSHGRRERQRFRRRDSAVRAAERLKPGKRGRPTNPGAPKAAPVIVLAANDSRTIVNYAPDWSGRCARRVFE